MATVFVTGATGVLGRGAVKLLIADGHRVRALARNPERAELVTAMGAEPIVGDIYDLDAMTAAMEGAETVLHLATRIPPIEKARVGNELSSDPLPYDESESAEALKPTAENEGRP